MRKAKRRDKEEIIFEIIVLIIVASLAMPLGGWQQIESRPFRHQAIQQSMASPVSQPTINSTQPTINSTQPTINSTQPTINSSALKVELVAEDFLAPTSMSFIGDDGDILVTQKGGKVLLFSIEDKTNSSIMVFPVNTLIERGLLGVAVLHSNVSSSPQTSNTIETFPNDNKTFVFFYLTEASKDNRTEVLGNRVYRFEWDDANKSLSNGTLILDLPTEPGQRHNSGKLLADSKSGLLYAVIGDVNRRNGTLQNNKDGPPLPDDTSVILRVNPDGSPAQDNPFLNISRINNSYANLSKYYAYGIRNSFGMDLDPLTGNLWLTENGPHRYDEINVVKPGFNSGWSKIFGPVEKRNVTENELVHFPGSHYADPVFSWGDTVGVTDIEFFESAKFGQNHTDNIFVGDFNHGNLYYFQVNGTRDGLKLNLTHLADDLVASTPHQVSAVIFGTGFGGITDIATGPDGYLYILTYAGKMYRIVPK
jgi:glucose/arabinose dehydrogenase